MLYISYLTLITFTDINTMKIYTQDHTIFGDSVAAFCQKHILPSVSLWEDEGFFPSSIFKDLGKEGLLGILIDEKWGGVGLDYIYAAKWCDEFGKVPAIGFTTAVNMHSLVITPTVQRYATKECKEEWLPRCVSGDAIGAYAFTEPNAGSDLSKVSTFAKKDKDSYILNGSKIFITNGKRADFVLVFARTDLASGYKGFTTFLVDTKLPGFSVPRTLDKLGWYCSDTAELVFEDVRVPANCVLGEVGQGWSQAMASLEWERLMLSLLSIAGIKQCIMETINYTKSRKVFDKSIYDFPINKSLFLEMLTKVDAARNLALLCLQKLNNKIPCRVEVSALKSFICEEAFFMANQCLQLHGGYGYTSEYPVERWLRDLRLNSIGGGTTHIMNRSIAREIIQ